MAGRISDNTANDAAAWMLNRLDGSIHKALNTDIPDITYDSDRQVFALLKEEPELDLQEIYREAESRKKAFIQTVDNYNADARRHGSMQMDIHAGHTWEDVLSVQRGILEQREAGKSRGFKGYWQTKMRRFSENSESFEAWLKILPKESHYLSVFCGGLTLVLGAAHRMAEIRESIMDVMVEIPIELSRAKQYIDIFAKSPELHKCSADLYVAILDTLDAIIQEYQKHIARRLSSAAFRQTMSGKDLQEKIKQVEACGTKLTEQANIGLMQRQQQMYENEKAVTRMIISSARTQDYGFNTLAQHYRNVSEDVQSCNMKLEKLASVVEPLNRCLALLRASPLPLLDPTTGVQYLMPGSIAEESEKRRSRSPSPNSTFEINQDLNRRQLTALLTRLSVDHQTDFASTDTYHQLRLIHTLSLASQDRAVALIISSQIETWLTRASSCALLINGHMFSYEDEARQSPLSYFCAKLVNNILARQPEISVESSNLIMAVRWFCGLHTKMEADPDAHPPGMLSNLLSQLIRQLLQWLPQVALGGVPMPGGELELPDLCGLFVQLVEALPAGTILLCMIDGISFYEDADRRAECMEVVTTLMDLTRRSQETANGVVIKLLVTAPLRSHHVQNLFEAEEILNLRETYTPSGGFSALHWNVGIGKVID